MVAGALTALSLYTSRIAEPTSGISTSTKNQQMNNTPNAAYEASTGDFYKPRKKRMNPPQTPNVTLPEDVRTTGWKVQSDATLKGKTKDQLTEIIRCLEHNYFGSQQIIERQYHACTAAKAEGIEIGRKQKGNSGRLQYQDGYRAGKVEGYTQGMHESVKHVDEGFAQGAKAMQEAMKKEIELHELREDRALYGELELHFITDQVADQLLNHSKGGEI